MVGVDLSAMKRQVKKKNGGGFPTCALIESLAIRYQVKWTLQIHVFVI